MDAQVDDRRTTETEEHRRQRWKDRREIAAFLLSIVAFCVSFGSCYYTGRNSDINVASVRAWVNPVSIDHDGKVVEREGDRHKFSFKVDNSGKTPANSVIVQGGSAFVPGPKLQWPVFPGCWPDVIARPGIIIGDRRQQVAFSLLTPQLSSVESKMIDDKTAHLVVYVCVIYNDVLDPDKKRLTEIAGVYPTPEGDVGIYPPYTRMR